VVATIETRAESGASVKRSVSTIKTSPATV